MVSANYNACPIVFSCVIMLSVIMLNVMAPKRHPSLSSESKKQKSAVFLIQTSQEKTKIGAGTFCQLDI
jgi:hypothetical protein